MSAFGELIKEFATLEDGTRQYLVCDRDGRNPKVIYPDHDSAYQCGVALESLGNEPQRPYQCEVDPTHHHLTRRDTQGQCACKRAA
jgi:hypothetical protein